MAATQGNHFITKLTHSYVNTPIDPIRKIPCTADERSRQLEARNERILNENSVLEEVLHTAEGNLERASHLLDMRLEATNAMIERLTDNIDNLSEEEFFDRLMALKADHRQTLDICEKLYLMQTSPSSMDTRMVQESEQILFEDTSDFIHRSIQELQDRAVKSALKEKQIYSDDRVESKPPAPPYRLSKTAVTDSQRHGTSSYWPVVDASGSEAEEDMMHLLKNTGAGESVATKVKELWKQTAIKDDIQRTKETITPHARRPRSASLSRPRPTSATPHDTLQRASSQEDLASQWRYRITVPQPFSMTLRDEQSTGGKYKSRAMIRLDEELAERRRQEEIELKKRFKASDVPAHVYLPMFESMMERQRSKREFTRAYRKEILKASEKPFNFYRREEQRKAEKEAGQKQSKGRVNVAMTTTQKPTVVARPVPASVKESRLERMEEDELIREVKLKMRADKLYREAKLPAGMEERQKEMERRLQEKLDRLDQEEANALNNSNKRKTHKVPDFNRLHQKASRTTWSPPQATVPQPFQLKAETRVRSRPSSASLSTSQRTSSGSGVDTRRSHDDWNKSILSAMEIPPAATNNSTALRESLTRGKLSARQDAEYKNREEEKLRRRRQNELAKSLRENTDCVTPQKVVEDITKERLSKLKRSEEQRVQEYHQDLNEMQSRIKERPLLVEQQARLIAKQQAERRYNAVLKEAGVDYQQVKDQAAAYHSEPTGDSGWTTDHLNTSAGFMETLENMESNILETAS